jgi:serine/threonine-protein kinase
MDASGLVGSILAGKYRVMRVLGEGGMGVVLAARHVDLEEDVAIKVLHDSGARDDETVARFLREAKASARIRSDHVVRVRDVGRLSNGLPFMVMELLEGLDLGQVLAQNGPLSLGVAVDYVLQASEAIAEAHAIGIVHRDLKPSNLFLTQRRNGKPCVKVLDFGISKLLGGDDIRKTSTRAVFGSPLYMSPEQLVSSADVDARADVWSMGVVLYELLVGETPFFAPSLAELHVAILQRPAPDVRTKRPDVPAPVAEAITRALAKKREERLGSIDALATALAPFASPVGLEAFDTLTTTTRSRRAAAATSSGSMPIVPAAAASLSSARPLAEGAPSGGATQQSFTTKSNPDDKGGPRPAVAIALGAFGFIGLVGVTAIASSVLFWQKAPEEPGVSSAAASTAPAPETNVEAIPETTAAAPPPAPLPPEPAPASTEAIPKAPTTATSPEHPVQKTTATSTSTPVSSAPRTTTKRSPPSVSSTAHALPDDRR